MTLDQIKTAVNAGKNVHWTISRYTVICDNFDQWLIVCDHGSLNANCVGLHWPTYQKTADQFYIA